MIPSNEDLGARANQHQLESEAILGQTSHTGSSHKTQYMSDKKSCSKYNSQFVGHKGDITAVSPKGYITIQAIASHLALFRANWVCHFRSVGSGHHQGYKIEFMSTPTQTTPPREGATSSQEKSLVIEEVQAMLKKGAVVEVPEQERPKKSGGMKPVINLKALNKFMHFKMEGMHTLRNILKENNWMTKVDLKDAYFMISIWETDKEMLHLSAQGCLFQFTCLPFDLSCAPWVFTKNPKPAMSLLREVGIQLLVYIEDILVMADSKPQLTEHSQALIFLLESLDFDHFIVHPENTLTNHEASNPASKGKEAPGRSSRPFEVSSDSSHSKGTITPSKENEFSCTGTPTRFTILQDNTKGLSPCLGTGQTITMKPSAGCQT